ncbi:MAG: GNAT family N-acetyltransferase [Spirochaetales bacterium]|nr:GNAT family N-acetyltransferase [Spirochaetales bacterium]
MKTDRGIIRRARYGEIERLSSLIRNTLLVSNSFDYDMNVIQNLSRQYSFDYLRDMTLRRRVYVHVTGEVIDGTVSLKGDTIYAFFVAPDRQRRGVGSRLLASVEETAKSSGVRTIRVDASLTAQKFYENRGYRIVGKERDTNYGTVFAMEKDLLP